MNHIIKWTAWITMSNAMTKIIALAFYVILARALTVADYGLFRYLITLSMIYAILFTGFPTALIRYIGPNRDNKKKVAGLLTNTLFAMLTCLGVLTIIIIAFNSHKIYLILLLFAVFIDSIYLGFVRSILNYSKIAGFKLTENLIQLAVLAVAFFVFGQISLTYAVVFFSLAGLAAMLILEYFRPEFKLDWKVSRAKLVHLAKYTIPLTLGSVGWTVMFGINAIFINYFHGTEQVGYYSIGVTIAGVFSLLPEAITTIMLPKVSGMKEKTKLPFYTKLAVAGSLAASSILFVVLVIFKHPIVTIVFSERYLASVPAIIPLAIGQIAFSIHQIYGSVWQGIGKPSVPSATISIAAVLNVTGSYFLTKYYGIFGSAVSTAITLGIATIIIAIIFRKKWKTH